MELYKRIASNVDSKDTVCSTKREYITDSVISWLQDKYYLSGSGFDNGVKLLLEESTTDKLVFACDFHHMNDNGHYCGWSHHKAIVRPTFDGFSVKVSGRDMRDIKDYIATSIHAMLMQDVQDKDYYDVVNFAIKEFDDTL